MYLTERDVWVLIFLFGLCGLLLIDNFFEVNRLENSLKTCRQDAAKLNAYNEYLYQEHLKTIELVDNLGPQKILNCLARLDMQVSGHDGEKLVFCFRNVANSALTSPLK